MIDIAIHFSQSLEMEITSSVTSRYLELKGTRTPAYVTEVYVSEGRDAYLTTVILSSKLTRSVRFNHATGDSVLRHWWRCSLRR